VVGLAQHRRWLSCYGTLEGYLKCVDADDINKELFKFKTPSGIIGNVFTWEHKGKQYIGVFSGIGGWAGIGMAAGLEKDRRPGCRGWLR
jgi:glucose dehydrogenase